MKLRIHRIVLVSELVTNNFFALFIDKIKRFQGDYLIEILQDGTPIDNNIYTSRAFDINKVIISDFPSTSIVDSPTYFLSKIKKNETRVY